MSDWRTGPAEGNWMEEHIPSGDHHSYMIDLASKLNHEETHNLLLFLGALGVISYGCFYEGIYQIRIKVR